MPTVRKASETSVSVNQLPSGYVGARVSPNAMGANVGNALTDLGKQIYADERKKADDLAFLSGVRRMGEQENLLLYDPEKGAYRTKGREAISAHDVAMRNLDDVSGTILAGMKTPEQRLRWQEYWINRRDDHSRELLQHTAKEISAYRLEETNDFVTLSMRNAARHWNDPDRVGDEIDNAKTAVTLYGSAENKTAEWIANKRFEVAAKAHTAVLDQILAAGDASAAQAYRLEHRDELTHEDDVRVTNWLRDASVDQQAQQMVDNIWGKGKSRGDHYAQIKALTDEIGGIRGANIRKAAEARIDHMYAVADAQLADQREMLADGIISKLDIAAQQGAPVLETLKQAISRSEWHTLDGGTRSAIRAYAANLAAGNKVVTDMNAYYSLVRLAGDDATKEQFAKVNLIQYRPLLDDEDFKYVVKLQKEISEGIYGEARKRLTNESRQSEMVDDTLRSLGIDTNDSSDDERLVMFRREARARIMRHEQITEQAITDEAMQELLDSMVTETYNREIPFWWDQKKMAFEVTLEDVNKASPDAEAKIRASFHANYNREPTDEEIVRVYNEHISAQQRRQEEADAKAKRVKQSRSLGIVPPEDATSSTEVYDPTAHYPNADNSAVDAFLPPDSDDTGESPNKAEPPKPITMRELLPGTASYADNMKKQAREREQERANKQFEADHAAWEKKRDTLARNDMMLSEFYFALGDTVEAAPEVIAAARERYEALRKEIKEHEATEPQLDAYLRKVKAPANE